MTLIIEDGTGKPDAESYASAEDLAMYAVKFGVVIPADVVAQEALLRRAALAMDGKTWKGRKTNSEQGLSWPRREDLKFGVVIPADVVAQEALLRRAALAMDGKTWKGRKTNSEQGLSWPRREVLLDREIKPNNYLPARIQYGQMALAAEIHQDDIDPVEKRKGAVTLERVEGAVTREYATIPNTSGRLLPAAPDRPSATQFADYLQKRGLFAVRA